MTVEPGKLLTLSPRQHIVGTKVVMLSTGSCTEVFLVFRLCIIVISVTICIQFLDKLCICFLANTENVEEYQISILHTNHEEKSS